MTRPLDDSALDDSALDDSAPKFIALDDSAPKFIFFINVHLALTIVLIRNKNIMVVILNYLTNSLDPDLIQF